MIPCQVPGYNPMQWDCSRSGCFNRFARPKIEIFARCFPGRVSMGDIDYEVEINGYHLRVEFKRRPGEIPTGQRLTMRSLLEVPGKFTVLSVAIDAYTMRVTHLMRCTLRGNARWLAADLELLELIFQEWSDKATRLPRWRP